VLECKQHCLRLPGDATNSGICIPKSVAACSLQHASQFDFVSRSALNSPKDLLIGLGEFTHPIPPAMAAPRNHFKPVQRPNIRRAHAPSDH